jgi:hypothetical protein
MAQPHNPQLKAALLEIVENQLRDNAPPETRATLERLLASGIPREEAMNLIAHVVVTEIVAVLNSGQPYDEARYVAGLHALPQVAWETQDRT